MVLLALLYTAGSLQIDSLHRLIHQHGERTLHTPEQEQDPCHRVVFHHQTKGACEHPTHFSESKKCPLCHGTPAQAAIPGEVFQLTRSHQVRTNSAIYLYVELEKSRTLLPARAPPVNA